MEATGILFAERPQLLATCFGKVTPELHDRHLLKLQTRRDLIW
jgi:hypothetical protein